jgi:hypothetical protein
MTQYSLKICDLIDSFEWDGKWYYIFQNGTLLASMELADQTIGNLFVLANEVDKTDFIIAEIIISAEKKVMAINYSANTLDMDTITSKYTDELEKLI